MKKKSPLKKELRYSIKNQWIYNELVRFHLQGCAARVCLGEVCLWQIFKWECSFNMAKTLNRKFCIFLFRLFASMWLQILFEQGVINFIQKTCCCWNTFLCRHVLYSVEFCLNPILNYILNGCIFPYYYISSSLLWLL